MDQKLLERIKKLLSLATSDNEHEAKIAAERANELLIRHNLSIEHVEQLRDDDFVGEQLGTVKKRITVEDKLIRAILGKFFFVSTVQIKFGRNGSSIKIMGEKTNIQIASYVYSFLHRTFKDLWNAYKKQTGATVGSKQSYYLGLYDGLYQQLNSQKNKIVKECEANTNALAIVDEALEKYVKQMHPEMKYSSLKVNNRDMSARDSGREHGENIRIHRGISEKSNKQGFLK
jgi:hypothetical protein